MKALFAIADFPAIHRRIGFFCVLCFLLAGTSLSAETLFEKDIRNAAETGDAESQYALALLYEYGSETIARDSKKAAYWLEKSAQQKIAGACLYLGLKYENGNGVDQDYPLAHCWYQCAATQDWPMAQFFLANLYEKGKGVSVSKHMALGWFSLAAEHGYPKADIESARLRKELGRAAIKDLGRLQKKLMEKNATPCN